MLLSLGYFLFDCFSYGSGLLFAKQCNENGFMSLSNVFCEFFQIIRLSESFQLMA